MQKQLLTAVLAMVGLTLSPAINAKTLYNLNAQDRTNWSITGCSEHNDNSAQDKDGGYDRMKDGNDATFWHSDYNQTGHPNSCPHYIVIDRGADNASTTVGGFGYLPRQAEGNGFATEYRIFFVDDITGLNVARHPDDQANQRAFITDGHESLTAFLDGKTPTASGNLGCVYNTEAGRTLKTVVFDAPTTGRYAIFVIDGTSSSAGANLHANCAEFYLYDVETTEVDTEAEKEKLALYSQIVPANAISAANEAIDAATTAEEVHNAVSTVLDYVAGQVIAIKNLRRDAELSGQSYLAFDTNRNKLNTSTTVTELSKWILRRVNNTEYFRLYNPEKHAYISSADNEALVADANNACQITLTKNTSDTYPGIALQFIDSANGLNISNWNSDADNLTSWSKNDPGSSWALSLVSVTLDELDTTGSTYYRIRSARGQEQTNGTGLIGINTIVENGLSKEESYPVIGRRDGLGVLWSLHDAGDGNVYIRNAAADFEGEEACYGITGTEPDKTEHGGQSTIVSANPKAIKIVTAKGAANSAFKKNEHGLAILTNEAHHLYMDNTGNTPNFSGWDRVNENFPNNGGVYYFEPVAEADAEAVKNSYIALMQNRIETDVEKVDALGHFPNVWDTELLNNVKATVSELVPAEITSPKDANAWDSKWDSNLILINEALDDVYSSADGKQLQFVNGRDNFSKWYLTTHTDDKTMTKENATGMGVIWTLEYLNDGHYNIMNHATGKYLKSSNGNSTWTTTDTPDATLGHFALEPYVKSNGDYVMTIKMFGSSEHVYLHDNSWNYSGAGTHNALGWSGNDGEGSHWAVILADDDAVADSLSNIIKLENSAHKIVLSNDNGVSVIQDFTYLGHHDVTITPIILNSAEAPQYFAVRPARNYTYDPTEEKMSFSLNTQASQNGNSVEIDLNNILPAGDYEMKIPVATFNVGDKYNKELVSTFNISEDGSYTGISEVEEALTVKQEAVYDLQGRRLAKPVRGINIINGRKVMCK